MGYQDWYKDSRSSNNAPECSIMTHVSSNKIGEGTVLISVNYFERPMRCRKALCFMSLTAWTRPKRLALGPS